MPRKAKGGRKNRKLKPALPERFEPGCVLALDQRTALAQRLRDNFASIVCDVGGEAELSHIKAALIERMVFLEAILGGVEADLMKPEAPANRDKLVAQWVQAVNAYSGLAKVIGINRKAHENPWSVLDHKPPVPQREPEGTASA
jgi:hypothetical protein